jgi:2,3-bisphosphoglycerate-independent phosphoglycerate mutase
MAETLVKQRPCILIVRDGWGENPDSASDATNAIKVAQPPFDALLRREWPMTLDRDQRLRRRPARGHDGQ